MFASIVLALGGFTGDPCALLDSGAIARVLGWSVRSSGARTYRMAGGSGQLCAFDGRDGSVIVTIATKGTGVPVNDVTSDLGSLRTPMHDVFGLGLPAELGRGAAIVHARGADYGITVQPVDAQFADERQMRALASALVRHLPPRRTHSRRA